MPLSADVIARIHAMKVDDALLDALRARAREIELADVRLDEAKMRVTEAEEQRAHAEDTFRNSFDTLKGRSFAEIYCYVRAHLIGIGYEYACDTAYEIAQEISCGGDGNDIEQSEAVDAIMQWD